PFALVGSHDRADLCLKHTDVTLRHAFLAMIAGHTYCVDLGSRTGTHWNGGGAGHGWLPVGAPCHIGPYRLSMLGSGVSQFAPPDGWDPWAKRSQDRRGLPSCVLNIGDGHTVYRWRLNRVLAIVGCDPICKVRLNGPGVGRVHCALIGTSAGLLII